MLIKLISQREKYNKINLIAGSYLEVQIDIIFPNTAILKVTQTNHQNVSNLNGKRLGQLYLLPCKPPQWKVQTSPPIKTNSIFDKNLSYQVRESFKELQNLLLAIKFNELSLNSKRKQHITDLVTEIADIVLNYASLIHGLKKHIGWSQQSKLPSHQQYWLDPFRSDKDFQMAKANSDWLADIVNDFAKWLNWQLKHRKLTLGISQEKTWRKIFFPMLREFNAITDAAIKHMTKENGKA